MQNGLSLQEATNRVADITRNTNLPAFATATQMAGITEGGVVKSSTQLQSEAKAEEFDAIYGNDPQIDPHAGFRPSTTVRQVDPALAEAALAAFAEDAQPKTVASTAPVSGKVKSGGVALPQSTKPVSHKLKSDCTSCGKAFTVEMPPSINSAVVACPHCGSDQLFER